MKAAVGDFGDAAGNVAAVGSTYARRRPFRTTDEENLDFNAVWLSREIVCDENYFRLRVALTFNCCCDDLAGRATELLFHFAGDWLSLYNAYLNVLNFWSFACVYANEEPRVLVLDGISALPA